MKRPITIITGQFGDLPFEEVCQLMSSVGYEGLEVACHAHVDVHKILEDDEYFNWFNSILDKYGLKVWALSAHLIGQCVGDRWDKRLDNFAPSELAGKPEEIRAWAIEEMKVIARAAQKLGVKIVTGFTGSPIWYYWYSFPQTTQEMVEEGFQKIKELWTPIFDVFDECGVRFALEVHPSEIAFDYYTTQKLFQVFEHRPTLGLNFDPSHLLWQGVNPNIFLRDFSDRIYHVHLKDIKMSLDGRGGILGSHIEFGDTRRGWNFVSLGHGDVDFDGIIRELNQMGYKGPLSVEWEDSGMDRLTGIKESYELASRINFEPSDISFDSALKVE
ncbi:MAG: sugar phosphate isomerase/epimerase family protein [Tissierellaceae bacterium]|jgi:sugar phosphate isomerase/epimerase|nr:sugar phosphate isomerase/epimerase [Tissierellia bacterium]